MYAFLLYFFLCLIGSHMLLTAQIHIGPTQQYQNIEAAVPFIKPGDTVYVHAGTYARYQYIDGLKGMPDKWITIQRFENDSVIIRGGWQFSSVAYIHLKNLFFRADQSLNSTLVNIDNKGDCKLQSHHIRIENCSFYDVGNSNSLKFGGVDSFVIEKCTVVNNTNTGAGIALNICHDGVVRNCVIRGCKGKALQTKLGTARITIEKNLIEQCGEIDAALKIGESGDLIYHCSGENWTARSIDVISNIIIGGRASFTIGSAQYCRFINNTCIEPQNFVFRLLGDQTIFECRENLIANNIFYLKKTVYLNGSNKQSDNIFIGTMRIENNLFFNADNPAWKGPDPDGGIYDAEELKGAVFANNISANPEFTNPANGDYTLKENSPCINAGSSYLGVNSDFEGKNYGAKPSLGALASGGSLSSVSEQNTKSELSISPVPVKMGTILSIHKEFSKAALVNINGQLMNCSWAAPGALTMDYPTGVYMLILYQSDGNISTYSVIVN
jgi:hypothetical protein